MPELTIKQIQGKARKGTLPYLYRIQTPLQLSSEDLIETLNCFDDNLQMLHFIDLLSENSEITILVNNKSIRQGSRDRFIHAYTRHDLYPEELDETKQNRIIAHLKSIKLSQKQLSYLLHNLNWYAINNFLLRESCFFEEDLRKLCQDLDELKDIPEYCVKLLYHYLNPNRCWKESLTPLLDMYYFAYRIGHVLGLAKPVTVNYRTEKYSFETGYAPTEVSVKLLTDYLDAYTQTNYSPVFAEITKAYKKSCQLLEKNESTYKNHATQTLLSQYRKNQLIALMPNWDEHTVSVSLRGDYLVYTNRGLCGDRRYGSKIFKIKARSLIDEDFLQGLITAQSHTEFNNLLKRVIDFKSPVARFSSKAQKYDNCTFSNPKANVEALIVLLQTKPDATEDEVRAVAFAERNRRKYKHFSNFMRNREIDELVKNMFYAQHPMLIQFYANLVKQVITAHHGQRNQTAKDRNDRARALDLFARTPSKIQRLIRQDRDFMAIFDKIPKPVTQKTPPGFLWRHIEYVRNDRGFYSHKVEVEDGYILAIDDIATPKMTFNYANTRRLCTRVLKNW